jgi:Lactoylglutathione lyase and related lyases
MKIDGIDHVSVNALDITESLDFYKNVFGFSEIGRADMGECILIYLQISENACMELFDLKGGCKTGYREENLQGFRHIAFKVDDINVWNKKLKDKGIKFAMDLIRLEPIKKDCLLIEDPNGVIIELCADAK